jgi:RNase P subunit RPR2
MATKYKFLCKSCKYECISGIGNEIGPRSSEVAMTCSTCVLIDTYTVPNSESISAELPFLSRYEGLVALTPIFRNRMA